MSVPKVRESALNEDATLVGNPLFGQFPIQGFTYDALLVSEPHFKLRNGAWNGGGPFYKWSLHCMHSPPVKVPVKFVCGDFGTFTVRGVLGGVPFGKPSTLTPPSFQGVREGIEPYFATAYARTRPGNPVASGFQFLYELRADGLPSLPGAAVRKGMNRYPRVARSVPLSRVPVLLRSRLQDFRSLGSEYLNVVFGWKPFVRDLQKMYYLWKDIDKRMAQIVRDNGRSIRRRTTLEDSTSTSQESMDYPLAYANVLGSPPNWWPGTTAWSKTVSVKTKVWFSASYRYFIPDTSSSLWTARARSVLFGTHVTPGQLWEVLPWSWLVDWFGNVGDVMSNASQNAVDNLTMDYSFTMKQVTTETLAQAHVTHSSSNDPCFTWPSMDQSFWSKSTETSKARWGGGNPFGLNVKLESLSAYQLSILAALGISKSRVR